MKEHDFRSSSTWTYTALILQKKVCISTKIYLFERLGKALFGCFKNFWEGLPLNLLSSSLISIGQRAWKEENKYQYQTSIWLFVDFDWSIHLQACESSYLKTVLPIYPWYSIFGTTAFAPNILKIFPADSSKSITLKFKVSITKSELDLSHVDLSSETFKKV